MLERLALRDNRLPAELVTSLASQMTHQTSLTHLWLQGNNFDPYTSAAFGLCLVTTSLSLSLVELYISLQSFYILLCHLCEAVYVCHFMYVGVYIYIYILLTGSQH